MKPARRVPTGNFRALRRARLTWNFNLDELDRLEELDDLGDGTVGLGSGGGRGPG